MSHLHTVYAPNTAPKQNQRAPDGAQPTLCMCDVIRTFQHALAVLVALRLEGVEHGGSDQQEREREHHQRESAHVLVTPHRAGSAPAVGAHREGHRYRYSAARGTDTVQGA